MAWTIRCSMAFASLLFLALSQVSVYAAVPPLPDGVRIVELGKPETDNPSLVSVDGDRIRIRATGRYTQRGEDQGTFVGARTSAPNFTFEARFLKAPSGTPDPIYGLTVRDGLTGFDLATLFRYNAGDSFGCIVWRQRNRYTPSTHDGSYRASVIGSEPEFNKPEGFWLRVQRRYPVVRGFVSMDGENWSEIAADYSMAMLTQDVYAGINFMAGGDGKQPVELVCDRLRFEEEPVGEEILTREAYKEYRPPVGTWRMYLIQADGAAKGAKSGNPAAIAMNQTSWPAPIIPKYSAKPPSM